MTPSQPPLPFALHSESFHAQHSPFGAFASFTLGLVGAPGGFGQCLAKPAAQNVYVGFLPAGQTGWKLLPFFTPPKSAETAYTGEAATAQIAPGATSLSPEEYERSLGAATDVWEADAGRFRFGLATPFARVPDPRRLKRAQARAALAPSIAGWLEYDNRKGSAPVRMMFGIGDGQRPFRPLDSTATGLCGFASGHEHGFATTPRSGAEARQGFDVFGPKFKDHRGLHVIGGEAALVFTVPAGRKRRIPLALGFYLAGLVTTGVRSRFAYTRCFTDLEDVLAHALGSHSRSLRVAAARDRELAARPLSADQRFLIAQSIHSYLGSTQLLWSAGRPLWVVNEGEYRMINTFDLTVDHLFYELHWHPWTVRDTLDLFAARYRYTDRIKHEGALVRGGVSFTHDMGVMNHFTPPGRSSYECDHLTGCFSHMTMEQLLNWVLCAATYGEKTRDLAWLKGHRGLLLDCAESLRRRDHPDPAKRDGILKHDTERCGPAGAEITTYDSLDVSLGQARNNLYLAVKTLAAWLLLGKAFARLGLREDAVSAGETADLVARTLTTRFEPDTGCFPAVFEAGNRSRILPAVEGLVFPLYLGHKEVFRADGRFGRLLECLRSHLKASLRRGVCLDPVSGAWKISSTSDNTWFSKIALAQHVVRRLFPEALDADAIAADRVHADWQRRPGCGRDAMCDQILSPSGLACGSRYYPRGVTTWLWVGESA